MSLENPKLRNKTTIYTSVYQFQLHYLNWFGIVVYICE